MKQSMRIYADTSVFGGVFDPEFSEASRKFFENARNGMFEVIVSALVINELEGAPPNVQSFFKEFALLVTNVEVGVEAYDLQQAYLAAHVVSSKSETDALHVATATANGCRVIVSWNFKHIVNFRRIQLYNGINQIQGYGPIAIHTPQEVMFYEEDQEKI
jgi:predicted nucleic acid-binding protein